MTHGLNAAQSEAVRYLDGPCLVLAGAGSGKTRVITQKIAHLIEDKGFEPRHIAAVTFTNKAAKEMQERIAKLMEGKTTREGKRIPLKQLTVCTFHSLGVQILRMEAEHVGLKPQFSIMDSDDCFGLVQEQLATTDKKLIRSVQSTISLWKNGMIDPEAAIAQAASAEEHQAALVYRNYVATLHAYQAVDFDDLIRLPAELFARDETVRLKWQNRLRYFLVDEYQDTNATQYEVLKHIVGERACFTAVGDDDQSIYGWRGATLDNLKRLPQDFPKLKVIKLEQNYRSTSAILRAANNVIGPNPKLFPKTLFSELGEGEPVRVVDADNEEHEAERAVARIQSIRAGTTTEGAKHREFKDFAILYRANHMARPFEQALRRAQIPYKVSGGQSFFDKAEIKDLCAWFRLWINNDDDPAFLRAITSPKRGIGHQTLAQLGTFATKYKVSLFEALFASSLPSAVSSRALHGLHEFGRYINDLEYRARHTAGKEDAMRFLTDWLKEIGYEKHLYDGEDNEKVANARWTNVLEFCDWMAGRCGGEIEDATGAQATERKSLLEVAQTVSLISTLNEREEEQNVVTLSTLHASKGLEWPHVMLVGVNEGLLPFKLGDDGEHSGKADGPMSEGILQRLQEERRLMYVGITRAQRSLAVSWTRRRKQGRENVAGVPSRFIAEMALDKATAKEDPREKLKALRAEFAKRAATAAPPQP
ncbi:MAG: ATP-dependent DNA helicase Rep [Nevskiaceae bacterium]|nr:MAG: ATP-dependent DNA helicase Rep [Nevskiaceae bacterium]